LIVDGPSGRIAGIVHDERAKRRQAAPMVAHEGGVQVGKQAQAQIQHGAAPGFYLFTVRRPLVRVIDVAGPPVSKADS
jgi:hypothetical protein